MCGRNERYEMLSIALQSCLVVEVLLDYELNLPLHRNAEKALNTIGEVREVLNSWGLGHPSFSHRSPYRHEQMKLIHKVAKQMEPPITVAELEQWLANIERVREFFSALQGWANSHCLHQ